MFPPDTATMMLMRTLPIRRVRQATQLRALCARASTSPQRRWRRVRRAVRIAQAGRVFAERVAGTGVAADQLRAGGVRGPAAGPRGGHGKRGEDARGTADEG